MSLSRTASLFVFTYAGLDFNIELPVNEGLRQIRDQADVNPKPKTYSGCNLACLSEIWSVFLVSLKDMDLI